MAADNGQRTSFLLSFHGKTYGKPVKHWLELLDAMRDNKHMEQVAFLKSEYKIGHGHANALVACHRAQQEA